MRRARAAVSLLLLAGAVPAVAACGGDASRSSGSGSEAVAVASETASQRDPFPAATGAAALADMSSGMPTGPWVSPVGGDLRVGRNALAFTLRDRAGTPLEEARVALYRARADGSRARGPYLARSEVSSTGPAGVARDDSRRQTPGTFYVADVPMTRRGTASLVALVVVDGRVLASAPFRLRVR